MKCRRTFKTNLHIGFFPLTKKKHTDKMTRVRIIEHYSVQNSWDGHLQLKTKKQKRKLNKI